jgi:tetratricopeptide (TPR) repeat protein
MKNKLLFVVFILSLASCSIKKNVTTGLSERDELEYFYTFTEATNRALLLDYPSAIELYKACIKKFPDKPAPYYQISQIFLTDPKYIGLAKKFALKSVELNDSNKWYLLNLASIFNYEKNVDSLIYVYEKLVNVSADIEYKYQLANLYSMSGEYDKALKLSNVLDQEMGETKEVLLMKHKLYDALNMHDSAVSILEQIINLFPEENENYGMLAEYLSVLNKYSRANEIYIDLLKRDSLNGMANISYADFFYKQNQNDSAIKYYVKGFKDNNIVFEDKATIIYGFIYNESSIQKDSILIRTLIKNMKGLYHGSRPYVISSEYYLKIQQYESCLIELDSAIKKGDTNYVIWEKYILMCNYLGKHEKIKEIYSKAIGKFPNAINLYIYSGYSLLSLKDYDDVIVLCDIALVKGEKTLANFVQVSNIMAEAFRGKEMFDESDSIYELILVKDPNNLLIRNNYSYYLSIRNKSLSYAEELSRLTVDKEPKNSTYLDTYGWILFQMGNTKDALRYIEAAIKNGAYNNSEVLDHYGDIMMKSNRCSEAIEAWQEAIKYDKSFINKINQKIQEANQNCLHE